MTVAFLGQDDITPRQITFSEVRPVFTPFFPLCHRREELFHSSFPEVLRHLFFNPKSASSKRSNGFFGLARPKSHSWCGVIGEARNRPALEIIFSTIANVVTRTSSVTTWFAKIRTRARLADFTKLSQAPPKCGAPDGLKTHFTCLSDNLSWILFSSRRSRHPRNSLCAPTKFVPRSL